MEIRKPKADELSKIRKFILGIIKGDFGYEYNSEWHWDIDDMEATYLIPSGSILLAAFEGEEIIGTIAARPYDKNYPEFVSKYNKGDTLGIWRHYIKKEKRNHGIGKVMYALVEEFAKMFGYKFIYLHTQKTIPGSKEYWLKRGFRVTLEKDDEWKTVHMEKVVS